ncbi:MAG: S24 family peptidase [Verrucomicrobia bacterium]|nr:S24 family peptidase [Verrucomicrobiota bacterium]
MPQHLCAKNRFLVRVNVDSMRPSLSPGDLANFEYHRSPRRDGDIVIANLKDLTVSGNNLRYDLACKRCRLGFRAKPAQEAPHAGNATGPLRFLRALLFKKTQRHPNGMPPLPL